MRGKRLTAALETAWASHKKLILVILCLGLGLMAAQRLAGGFHDLVLKPQGAVDLRLRYHEVERWFRGESLAGNLSATYPPATMALLWPMVGWESFPAARWLWALTSAAALAWLSWFIVRESGRRGPWEKAVLALIPLAVYTARAVLVNGQLALHLIPALLGGVILLERMPAGWKRDLAVAALLLFGLIKPTLAVPFCAFLLTARRPVRPILMLSGGYAALTVFASLFQTESLPTLIRQWYRMSFLTTVEYATKTHANIPSWLHRLGLDRLNLPASLLALVLLIGLLVAFRRSNVWLRLGLAAVAARVWGLHLIYDDALLVVTLAALILIVVRWEPGQRTEPTALALTLLLALSLMIPARMLTPGWRWTSIIESGQTVIWLAAFAYLAFRARLDHRAAVRSEALPI